MDWTAFWTGVGALATVVTLVIGLIVFIRGRSRVVVRVVRHDNYTLPPSLIEFFDQLERVGYSSLPKPDFIESVEPDEMRELLQALKDIQKNKKLMEFIRFPGSPKMWVFNVINRGHERAEKIELQVAEAIQSLVIRSDETREVIAGGIIRIPELRPGESVRVLSWTGSYLSDNPKLLQGRGKATMRFQKLIDSRVASFYEFWLSPIGFLIGIGLLGSLSLLIVQGFLLFRMVSR